MGQTMPAAPILQQIYRAHIEHFGEPDRSVVFDDSKQIDGFRQILRAVLVRQFARFRRCQADRGIPGSCRCFNLEFGQ